MSVLGLASAESGERRILVIEEKSLGLLLKVVVDRGALEARERAQRVGNSFRHTDAMRLPHQPQRFFFRFPDLFAGLAFRWAFFFVIFFAAFFFGEAFLLEAVFFAAFFFLGAAFAFFLGAAFFFGAAFAAGAAGFGAGGVAGFGAGGGAAAAGGAAGFGAVMGAAAGAGFGVTTTPAALST